MNPANRIWDLPPPPGTEDEEVPIKKNEETSTSSPTTKKDEETPNNTSKKEKEGESNVTPARPIDRIDPFVKNPEYIEYKRRYSSERGRHRSRTPGGSRDIRRKRHSRSRSKGRPRRSDSRSKRRRRPSCSRSPSRSRSPSFSRHRRHKYNRRRRSASRSRSRSHSRSHRSSHKSKSHSQKSPTPHKRTARENAVLDADISEVDMKIEDDEEEDPQKDNVFKNDGSFLEMFKKMQEQQKQSAEVGASVEEEKKPVLPTFGKRRGGKVLKTGMVQKVRLLNDEEGNAQDAWSIYMKEVRKYKEACCDDDSKTRPLVK